MSIVPPNAYITPASPTVVEQITRLNAKADNLDDTVTDGLKKLSGFVIKNVGLDPRADIDDETLNAMLGELGVLPEFDPNTNWLTGLSLSAGDEDFQFNPEIYQYLRQMLPEFALPALGTLPPEPNAPSDPGEPEDISVPVRPALGEYAAPDVDLSEEAPEYGDYTSEIPFPVLRPIDLPPAPSVDTDDITFKGVRPIFDVAAPSADDFLFVNEDYTGQLLAQTKTQVLSIFNGSTGLPAAVEDALFERAREREVELGERQVDQARNDWAARGWKQPPGMLASAEYRARRDASDKVSQLNRDQFVTRWQNQLDMLKTALSTAMTLEDVWSKVFISAEERRLQAARMKLDLSLQVFNALVSRFQAQAQLYSIDAQVFVQQFQAEQVKVQLYAEELRAKQLIGELNEQDVRIFAQRLGALQTNADIYRAQIEGFKAKYTAIQSKVDVFRAQLESNQTLMAGYESDVRAFTAQQQGISARDDRFKTRADIYASNLGAWKTRFDLLVAQQDQAFKAAGLQRDVFASNTDRIRAFVDSERGRVESLRDKYAALASEIGSKSEVERARYQLMLSLAQAKIARYESASNILLKNGEINIQAALSAENMVLRAQETATTTAAQLAAGYTSAASVHASISDGSSSSLSYTFQGELDVD